VNATDRHDVIIIGAGGGTLARVLGPSATTPAEPELAVATR
jgi:hypothetical protein